MNALNHHQVLIKLFKEHFSNNSDVTGVEIGTFCGDSARAILWTLPNCSTLYSIDPWKHFDQKQFEAGEQQPYHDNNTTLALSKFEAPDIKGRIVQLEMTSVEAYELLKDKKFDFVWIDGSHEGVDFKKDIELYQPLVKEGGIFGGHDFGQIPEVTEIVFKSFDRALWSGNDFTWWVLK